MNGIANRVSGLPREYRGMLEQISMLEPQITQLTSQHGKTHTQFQYAMLDTAGPIAGPTKLRNLRTVLAVCERTRDALDEAALNAREHTARAKVFRERANKANGSRELLLVKAEQAELRATKTNRSMAGAVRKLSAYYQQATELAGAVRNELGKSPDDPITETDFENDEERFHIKKAFEQALTAARGNGLRIDHGNLIYLNDIGINGRLAQEDIARFFQTEDKYRHDHPGHVHELHENERGFLEAMANKYAGCSRHYATAKGLAVCTHHALLGNEK